jgi:hypothetical protein
MKQKSYYIFQEITDRKLDWIEVFLDIDEATQFSEDHCGDNDDRCYFGEYIIDEYTPAKMLLLIADKIKEKYGSYFEE